MDNHSTPPPDPLAVLTAALASLKPNPSTVTLKTPSFEWSAHDQSDEFQVFHESFYSWLYFQRVPNEPGDNGDRIEYVLNFLGTAVHRKFNQWKPAGATSNDYATAKGSLTT